MGSMAPGRPNFFLQAMQAWMQGQEDGRREREQQMREQQAQEERKLRLETLKFEQNRIKLEDKIRAATMNRQGSLDMRTMLQGMPTPRQELPEGMPGPPQPTGPTSMNIPGISVPEMGIDVPSFQAPIQYQEDMQAQLARAAEMKMLESIRQKQAENQVALPPGMEQFGQTIDARAIPLLPKPPESLAVEPGMLPYLPEGGTVPKPLLDQLAGVFDQQQQNSRSAASVAATRDNAQAARDAASITSGANRSIQQEQNLRSDYEKKIAATDGVVQKIQQAKELAAAPPSGQNDMALVFTFMKALDEGVVRETEYARAASIGSMQERAKATLARLQSGELLTPAQRTAYIHTLDTIGKSVEKQRGVIDQRFAAMAQKRGVDPAMFMSGPAPQTSVQEGQIVYDPQGRPHRIVNGQPVPAR